MHNLLRKSYSKKLRNFFCIKPSSDILDLTSEGMSVSDAFFWRTDNKFETVFRLTNILRYFYKIKNSSIRLIFFSNENKLIKEFSLTPKKIHSEILINKSFMKGIESYGVFYVFHETKDELKTIVRNSCYTGYSFNKNIPSMVHGNTITAQKKFFNKNIKYGIGGYSLFKNRIYIVQNFFGSKKIEVMLVNPVNTKISVKVNEQKFDLKKGCVKIVCLYDCKLIQIKSKCFLLRPIIFETKDQFIDVYHG